MNKGLFTYLSEAVDQYRAQQRATPETVQPSLQNLRAWLPSRGTVLFVAVVAALLVTAQAAGALPLPSRQQAPVSSLSTIAYQGRLADAGGSPLTGSYNMTFRLYNTAVGGAPLWEEFRTAENSVNVSDGLFNAMLGSVNPIHQDIITGNEDLYLGIAVGSDSEMSPRVHLGSVPYATQALTVPDGAVTAAKIADGAITASKLGSDVIMGVPAGTIVMWSGSITSIPTGWALCDGANGTPDLRNRFILAVSEGENPGGTGGVDTVTPSGAVSGGAHTHTGRTGAIGSGGDDGPRVDGGGYPLYYGHTHPFTTDPATPPMTFQGDAFDNRPAYFKLAFIMKL